MINTNDYVKVLFKTGIVEEGIVLSWTDDISIIQSKSGNIKLIILNTKENVIAIKIITENKTPVKVCIDDQIELPKYEPDTTLRVQKLTELRLLRQKEERKRARELLTTFESRGLPMVEYGLPGRISKPPSSLINSGKEAIKRPK